MRFQCRDFVTDRTSFQFLPAYAHSHNGTQTNTNTNTNVKFDAVTQKQKQKEKRKNFWNYGKRKISTKHRKQFSKSCRIEISETDRRPIYSLVNAMIRTETQHTSTAFVLRMSCVWEAHISTYVCMYMHVRLTLNITKLEPPKH